MISGSSLLIGQSLRPDRVEPPFWWENMVHPQVQLLLHGSDLGEYEVRSDSREIKVVASHRADSPNYLFVDLDLSLAQAGHHTFHLYKQEVRVGSFDYEIKVREGSMVNKEGFNASDALYLITPDRFANGSEANDTIAGMREGLNRNKEYGRHGGDLKGIADNLDYIKGLGFTAIWLNPVLENDQAEWSYHGYSTTDYYKVDPRFGTNDEYLQLSLKASQMGIKLIMDMIENHCGSAHWWMNDLPFDDWLNFQNQSYQNTNHRKSTLHDPYVSQRDRTIMTDGWFVPSMPDLNQRNPFMSKYLIQNSIWWIEYARLAGIRQDTYSYPDKDFMSEWTCRIIKEYPKFNIVAEEWTHNQPTIAYWLEGKDNHDGYTSCLKSAMDFPLNAVLASAMSAEESWSKGFSEIYEVLANDFLYPNPMNMVIFPDNHDMSRIYTRVNEDLNAYRRALIFVATARGIPQLFYGTEILMANPGTDSHGIIRSDFPGGWQGDEKNAFTNQNLSEEEISNKDFVSKLFSWRRGSDVIHQGQTMHFIPEDGTYVYFRYLDQNQVMIVLNKNEDAHSLNLDRFTERLGDATRGIDILSDKPLDLSGSLLLEPHQSMIIEVD